MPQRRSPPRSGARFDPQPVPEYPPLLGIDPVGVDEYSAFANVPWPDVPPESHRWAGYGIGPVIGMQASPSMWSYHFPGAMTAALLFEHEYDVLDGLVWQLRNIEPPSGVRPGTPWWGSDAIAANYSEEQFDAVIGFLRFVREHGGDGPYSYDWEPADELTLRRWQDARGRVDLLEADHPQELRGLQRSNRLRLIVFALLLIGCLVAALSSMHFP